MRRQVCKTEWNRGRKDMHLRIRYASHFKVPFFVTCCLLTQIFNKALVSGRYQARELVQYVPE